MYDRCHTLFQVKYINNSLQIIQRILYLLQTFRAYVPVNFGGFATVMK